MLLSFPRLARHLAALSIFVLTVVPAARAQEICGFDALLERQAADPDWVRAQAEADALLFAPASTPETQQAVVHVVPIVFHIIYADGSDQISDAQILDQLEILNQDFRRQNADASNLRALFQPVAADPEIEFRLATLDPSGNCTNGINRVPSSLSINANDNVKGLISWDNNKYLNVWVVRSININISGGTVLGYAYPPSANQPASLDGIVIRHDRVGTIGSAVPDSHGRTLTHEVGHYFGLRHPFQGGCSGGDQVADTPPVALSSSGCGLSANTCTNDNPDLPDMLENYMDYSDEDCQNTFTQGQKTVMKNSIAQFALRGDVTSGTNLTATGLTGQVCTPTPLIRQETSLVCAGGSIQFDAAVLGGNSPSHSWTFPGGIPASSTQSSPLVTYNTPGEYAVTLTATNAAGSEQTTVAGAVRVAHNNLPAAILLPGNFDQGMVPNAEWTVVSHQDNVPFELQNTAFSGTGGLRIRSFITTNGQVDDLISQPMNLSLFTQAELRFQYAYQKRVAAGLSALRVLASTDCGQTWTTLRVIGGNQLSTNTTLNTTTEFVPTPSEWREASVDLSGLLGQATPVVFRFEFTAEGANNFYLDALELNGLLSESEEEQAALRIYPNPSSESGFWIQPSPSFSGSTLQIALIDALGRTLLEQTANGQGPWKVEWPAGCPAGVYGLRYRSDDQIGRLPLLKH